MQPRILSFTAFASALLLYGISSPAFAEELSTMENDNSTAIQATEQAAVPEALPWHTTENSLEEAAPAASSETQEDSFADARLSDDALDNHRGAQGGDMVVLNSQKGIVAGNTVNGDIIAGDNIIDNSFNDYSGTGLIIQNSAPHVSINGSVIVNLDL